MAQYYCLELILCSIRFSREFNIIVQYFVLLLGEGEKTWGGGWYSWGLCYYCFSPVFDKGKVSPLAQRRVHKKTKIHTRKSHERLKGDWAKRLQHFLRQYGPSFDGLLEIVTFTIAKRNTSMREAVTLSQRLGLSITLHCVDTGNTSEDVTFVRAVPPGSSGITVLETCQLMADRR
jgi:hypothetical protein